MEIAVVGEESFMIGFKLAGIKKGILAQLPEEYEKSLKELLKDPNIGMIIVSQEAFHSISRPLKLKIEETTKPVIFSIGEKRDHDLKNHIIKVVGVDLWK